MLIKITLTLIVISVALTVLDKVYVASLKQNR